MGQWHYKTIWFSLPSQQKIERAQRQLNWSETEWNSCSFSLDSFPPRSTLRVSVIPPINDEKERILWFWYFHTLSKSMRWHYFLYYLYYLISTFNKKERTSFERTVLSHVKTFLTSLLDRDWMFASSFLWNSAWGKEVQNVENMRFKIVRKWARSHC